MSQSLWFYLKNIFINPVAAAKGIAAEKKLWPLMLVAFLLGVVPYWVIVLSGYSALGWGAFPYKQYYPHYFEPYWWEMLLVPVWGLVLALGFGIPGYFLGRWFGGRATFTQVLAVVLLGAVVSLPILVLVDLFFSLDSAQVVEFARTGTTPPSENWLVRSIQQSYMYLAMGWQTVVILIGLTVVHRNRWFLNLPGIAIGTGVLVVFIWLIRDHVALIC